MGLGLVTDDRSREEGRHYTDDSAVRLHDCGAFGEAKPLKHPTLPAPGLCGICFSVGAAVRRFDLLANAV
ncbi:hypothetical protein EMIT0P44_10144 [Pseudomonas sp. IT-P44]